MEEQINQLRERLSNLSYNDLRKEAKVYSINARGKKIELIEKIVDAELKRFKDTVRIQNDLDIEKNCKMEEDVAKDDIKEHDIENISTDTYTVEPTNDLEDFLSDDMGEDLTPRKTAALVNNVKNISIISEDVSKSFTSNVSMKSFTFMSHVNKEDNVDVQLPEVESRILPNILQSCSEKTSQQNSFAKSGVASNRFEKQHKKLFDEMVSISDVEQKRKDRIEKQLKCSGKLSERIKQLASPKKIAIRRNTSTISIPQFSPPTDTAMLSFKFGDIPISDYAKVQKPITTTSNENKPPLRRSLRRSLTYSAEKKMDVKQMTMSVSRASSSRVPFRQIRQATTPVLSARLKRLATPRRSQSHRSVLDKKRGLFDEPSYTPHKGRYEYVDTTKMNNRELEAYLKAKGKK